MRAVEDVKSSASNYHNKSENEEDENSPKTATTTVIAASTVTSVVGLGSVRRAKRWLGGRRGGAISGGFRRREHSVRHCWEEKMWR